MGKRFSKELERRAWLALALLYTGWQGMAYAQSSGGASAITSATSEIKTYYTPLKGMIWIVAGCLGLVGAVRVYNKFTSSDPEASKNAAGFLGGGIALYAAELFIRKMFIE